ncbi:MAG: hypothetical protein J5379_06710 [Clostridiales bacterium]|nr:hypothetical protein [Clostridiales bacterium]
MHRSRLGHKCGAVLLSAIVLLSACKQADKTTSEAENSLPAQNPSSTITATAEDSLSPSVTDEDSLSSPSVSDEDPFSPSVPDIEDPDGDFEFRENPVSDAHDELSEEFRNLPGVVNVQKRLHFDDSLYILIYEMPIDHNDPAKGTFEQRVYVNYKGKDAPNQFTIGGYNLYYGMYDGDFYDEAESFFRKHTAVT